MWVVVALWLLPYFAAGFMVSKQSAMNSEISLYREEVFVIFNALMTAGWVPGRLKLFCQFRIELRVNKPHDKILSNNVLYLKNN